MENILYNELTARGFSVDVGVVETTITNAACNRHQSDEARPTANEMDSFFFSVTSMGLKGK